MPAQYEHIRDSYLAKGVDRKEAEKRAAMTYNAHRPKGATPMGPHYEERAHKLANAMARKGVK